MTDRRLTMDEAWYDLPPPERRKIEQRLGRVLTAASDVCTVWLFGSFSGGQPFRDIDIGILPAAGRPISGRRIEQLAGELEQATGRPRLPVDLKDLTRLPFHVQNAALSGGRCLFCRDDVRRIRFETEVMSRYLDYQPARRMFLDRARCRGRELGG